MNIIHTHSWLRRSCKEALPESSMTAQSAPAA